MGPQPPPAIGEDRKRGPLATKILMGLTFFCVLFVIFCLIKVVPTFADVFNSFGAKLPWLTTLVIGLSDKLHNPLVFGVTLVSYLLFVVVSVRHWETMPPSVASGLLVGWLFLIGFIIVAMFWPMFTLGNVKG